MVLHHVHTYRTFRLGHYKPIESAGRFYLGTNHSASAGTMKLLVTSSLLLFVVVCVSSTTFNSHHIKLLLNEDFSCEVWESGPALQRKLVDCDQPVVERHVPSSCIIPFMILIYCWRSDTVEVPRLRLDSHFTPCVHCRSFTPFWRFQTAGGRYEFESFNFTRDLMTEHEGKNISSGWWKRGKS